MSPERQARFAIAAVFAANGLLFASIVARRPLIQVRAGIGDGALGPAFALGWGRWPVSWSVSWWPLVVGFGSRPLVICVPR
jgi:hypothetical protein